jgi:hypothetical protein
MPGFSIYTPTEDQAQARLRAIQEQEQQDQQDQQLRSAGIGYLATNQDTAGTFDLNTVLEQAGADVNAPEVQLAIANAGDKLSDPNLGPLLIQALATQYPSVPASQYTDALAHSGFLNEPYPAAKVNYGQASFAAKEPGLSPPSLVTPAPAFQENQDTGWTRYKNGVLVDPSQGAVFFEPGSLAPGSPWWASKVVNNWSAEKVSEWRKRLHEMGYLTEDQAKVKGVDTVLINGLTSYHKNRYLNGGRPLAGDLAGASGGGTTAKPVDMHDFQAQIRNDVREQYRRIYGVDPTDGETQTWAEYVMSQAMQLQRKFIRTQDSPNTSTAATEAEERMVEKLQQSPEAKYLQSSAEENTRLRDTFERMAQVTQSLAS